MNNLVENFLSKRVNENIPDITVDTVLRVAMGVCTDYKFCTECKKVGKINKECQLCKGTGLIKS